jgi:hypothetical protein
MVKKDLMEEGFDHGIFQHYVFCPVKGLGLFGVL